MLRKKLVGATTSKCQSPVYSGPRGILIDESRHSAPMRSTHSHPPIETLTYPHWDLRAEYNHFEGIKTNPLNALKTGDQIEVDKDFAIVKNTDNSVTCIKGYKTPEATQQSFTLERNAKGTYQFFPSNTRKKDTSCSQDSRECFLKAKKMAVHDPDQSTSSAPVVKNN